MLDRNLLYENNVVKPLYVAVIFEIVRKNILQRNPVNVVSMVLF